MRLSSYLQSHWKAWGKDWGGLGYGFAGSIPSWLSSHVTGCSSTSVSLPVYLSLTVWQCLTVVDAVRNATFVVVVGDVTSSLPVMTSSTALYSGDELRCTALGNPPPTYTVTTDPASRDHTHCDVTVRSRDLTVWRHDRAGVGCGRDRGRRVARSRASQLVADWSVGTFSRAGRWLVRTWRFTVARSTSSTHCHTVSTLVWRSSCSVSHLIQYALVPSVCLSVCLSVRPSVCYSVDCTTLALFILPVKDDRQRFLWKVSKKKIRTVYYNANTCG